MFSFFQSDDSSLSEHYFTTFLSNIPNSIAVIFDKNHEYQFVCGDLLQKRNLTKEHFIGKRVQDFITKDELQPYVDHYNRALAGEKCVYESLINGRYYSHTIFPLINTQNEIEFGAILSQDIHELKMAQNDLVTKAEQYNWLTENSSAGFFDWDMLQDVTFRSKRVWEILEFEENELSSSFFSFAPYIHPEDAKWIQIIITDLLTNYAHPKTIQYRVFTKTGKTKWLEVKLVLIKNDQNIPIRMLATVLDVTSQKDSEEKILENEQLFKVLFKQSYHIHYLLETNGLIKEINNEALSMNAFDKASQPLVFVWDLPFFKDSTISKAQLKQHIQQASEGALVRFQSKIEKGIYKIIDFSIKPIFHHKGHVSAIMMEGREITEIIKASDHAIENARTISIKNKQLEEFAHITSHNLRSPAVNTKMLLHLWQTSNDETEKKMIEEKLLHSSDHLLDTIDTLAINLQIREDVSIEKEQIYFNDIFESIRILNSVILNQSDADVLLDFTEAPMVHFPKIYMESILQNLLTNSIKYASNKRKLNISLRSYYENGKTILSFSDNGLGIDLTKTQNKLFGLYKTFHGNTDARGVGLFITKTQIEAMGGKISVISAPDKGATFILQF
ncbi:MAG: PAS domain S-box protein [Cytophagales bacterium]|nr:PAS domain S-box protein [Cytophaga sp.]